VLLLAKRRFRGGEQLRKPYAITPAGRDRDIGISIRSMGIYLFYFIFEGCLSFIPLVYFSFFDKKIKLKHLSVRQLIRMYG
jgi:hypothetical protein